MEDIKVSVIVPSYKRHKEMFSRAIESLLAQTYENIEIVVVDDNIREDLLEYRRELTSYIHDLKSNKVVYVQNNGACGSAAARNLGIDNATGEYVCFLDDDDIYLPNKVKNQVEFMINNNLDFSFTNVVIKDENNRIVDFREFSNIKSFETSQLFQYHLTRKITPTDIYMVKKKLLYDIDKLDVDGMGDDFFLVWKIIKSGAKCGYLNSSDIILYREGQCSLTVGTDRILGERRLYRRIKEAFQKLTFRQRCYVNFRYNVTKLVTYKRAKKYVKMLGCMICAFFSDPISFFFEPVRMKKNVIRARKLKI